MQERQLLAEYERTLADAPRIVPLAKPGWASDLPLEAAVYVLWDGEAPAYVGETSSLRLRMGDLARPVNHPFTKKVCAARALDPKAYEDIAAFVSAKYRLSYACVVIGRAELEEYLVLRWRSTVLNKPAGRLLAGTQYAWVQSAA
jgi:hypothetical protein